MLTIEQESRIKDATEKCLQHATTGERPYARVADFMTALGLEAGWTSVEIAEVQARVIHELLWRHSG